MYMPSNKTNVCVIGVLTCTLENDLVFQKVVPLGKWTEENQW